ncbi:ZIP family metal transporter [Candidatus Woesearchaeota archaeon]|nr:ZIP family metal transporter [Candidatus Woesearchaeota archaeon]MCF7901528.1 ZIP family metal transporter [Candidatus Woesearchaeota archaeon]MCF8013872.1 ZIP family metal transporter [Candidatus Woesearchaeota archaeon]
MILYILLATLIISLVSFVGLFFLSNHLKKFLHYFISFAAGALLSVAFFDLIPESLEVFEQMGIHEGPVFILVGILLFFLIERFIHWHHCGKDHCDRKPVGSLSLIGDAVHNFIDGLLIAGAFLLNSATGIATTISVLLHEIPQEIGDFSVLLHAGYSKKKALLYNFFIALFAVAGGLVGYFTLSSFENIIPYVVSITAGGFIYIALSDILPDLHKHSHNKKMIALEVLVFLVTIVVFYFIMSGGH